MANHRIVYKVGKQLQEEVVHVAHGKSVREALADYLGIVASTITIVNAFKQDGKGNETKVE